MFDIWSLFVSCLFPYCSCFTTLACLCSHSLSSHLREQTTFPVYYHKCLCHARARFPSPSWYIHSRTWIFLFTVSWLKYAFLKQSPVLSNVFNTPVLQVIDFIGFDYASPVRHQGFIESDTRPWSDTGRGDRRLMLPAFWHGSDYCPVALQFLGAYSVVGKR